MKTTYSVTILSVVLCACHVIAASPAATQNWVRDYVLTNTPPGGGVSEAWVKSYVSTNTVVSSSMSNAVFQASSISAAAMSVLDTDTSTNRIDNACGAAVNAVAPYVQSAYDNGVRF